jgi:hypothetical protein
MDHRAYSPVGELSQSVSLFLSSKKNSEQFDHKGGLYE